MSACVFLGDMCAYAMSTKIAHADTNIKLLRWQNLLRYNEKARSVFSLQSRNIQYLDVFLENYTCIYLHVCTKYGYSYENIF